MKPTMEQTKSAATVGAEVLLLTLYAGLLSLRVLRVDGVGVELAENMHSLPILATTWEGLRKKIIL